MIVLDTSFLVAFFNEEDSLHTKALADMREVEKEQQLISDYVALETATVLNYKKSHEVAMKFLEVIKQKSGVTIHYFDPGDFESISEIFRQQRGQLSFIDASVIYLSKQSFCRG